MYNFTDMRLVFLAHILLFLIANSVGQGAKNFVVQTGHSAEVNLLKFSNNGNIFASSGLDNNIVLWDLESGKQLRTLSGHTSNIKSLVFTPNDSILGSIAEDSTARFWNTFTGELINTVKTTFVPTSMTYHQKKSKWYITDKVLYEFDLKNSKLNILQSPKRKPYNYVYYLNSGKLIFGNNKSNYHFELNDSIVLKVFGSITLFSQFKNIEDSFITGSKNGNIDLYSDSDNGITHKKTLRTGYGNLKEVRAISARKNDVLVLTKDNVASLIDYEEGMEQKVFISNYHNAKALDSHPKRNLLLTGANDGKIYLWDITSGILIREFKSNSSSINVAKFSPDGNKIILGYDAGIIRLWDLRYGGSLQTYKFRLNNKQLKKGWRYRVMSLNEFNDSILNFRVILTKPFQGSPFFEETRHYDFKWNTITNKKTFTEKFVTNYEFGEADYSSIVNSNNLMFENDKFIANANGFSVELKNVSTSVESSFKTPHSTPITSIDYNSKKDLFLTTSWDGKILLYNKNQELIARLVALGVDDFIIINKDNYYYSTKGALQYVGFTKGHEIQSFQQFDLEFNRPEFVYESIPYGSEEIIRMLESLHKKRVERFESLGLLNTENVKPPVVKIIAINGPVSKTQETEINISTKDKIGLRFFQVKIDGVPAFTSNEYHIGKTEIDTTIKIQLQGGINKITFNAANLSNIPSLNKSIYIRYDKKPVKPDLYFVGIGVSNYLDSTKNLKYASKDINDVQSTFERSKTYHKTYTLSLSNNQVVNDSLDVIDQFLSHAKINDVVILYYAGHGMLNNEFNYFLASFDNDFNNPAQKGIPYEVIEKKLVDCKSRKKLLFLDACHSGEVDVTSVDVKEDSIEIIEDINFRNAGVSIQQSGSLDAVKAVFADFKESNGITVISSAGGADYALESDQWKNGAFSYCLTDGLKQGKTDLDGNGVTTVSDLLLYLQINVPILTNGYQIPTFRTENIENDFILWIK